MSLTNHSLSFHHPNETKVKKKKKIVTHCLTHITGGKTTETALFSSARVFCMHFSHACVFPLSGGTAPPVEASAAVRVWGGLHSWNNRALPAKPWKEIEYYRPHSGRKTVIPLFTPRPQAASESGRQHLDTSWIFLVRSQDRERRGCAQRWWSQPSPKSPWL